MSSVPSNDLATIGAAERDTGIPKETLRIWERRYGFPKPVRDQYGERAYPPEQIARLLLVKRLLDTGYRPGKLMQMTDEELGVLAGKALTRAVVPDANDPELAACLDLLAQRDVAGLRKRFLLRLVELGLRRFVTGMVAPLSVLVGERWASGQYSVFEEHLFTECVQNVLRHGMVGAMQHEPHPEARPRVLLATVNQERHGLGLLMAEAIFTLEGAVCISLGTQAPINEIVDAAKAQRIDIVALSFSAGMSGRATVENLQTLQQRLGSEVTVWAGGQGAVLARRFLPRDMVLDLDDLTGAVTRWRQRHVPGPAASGQAASPLP